MKAENRRLYLQNLLENESAVKIQAIVRGFVGRVTAKRVYERQRQAIAVRFARKHRKEVRRQANAALAIQCAVRQWLARRRVYMRRQEDYITHPRVRALADMYERAVWVFMLCARDGAGALGCWCRELAHLMDCIVLHCWCVGFGRYLARGDLWGLLAAVNDDYEQQAREKLEEQTNAGVFLKEVLRVREFQERKEWRMWDRATKLLPGSAPTKGSITRMQGGTAAVSEMGRNFLNPKDPLTESLFAPFESLASAEAKVYDVQLPDRLPPKMSKRKALQESVRTPTAAAMFDPRDARAGRKARTRPTTVGSPPSTVLPPSFAATAPVQQRAPPRQPHPTPTSAAATPASPQSPVSTRRHAPPGGRSRLPRAATVPALRTRPTRAAGDVVATSPSPHASSAATRGSTGSASGSDPARVASATPASPPSASASLRLPPVAASGSPQPSGSGGQKARDAPAATAQAATDTTRVPPVIGATMSSSQQRPQDPTPLPPLTPTPVTQPQQGDERSDGWALGATWGATTTDSVAMHAHAGSTAGLGLTTTSVAEEVMLQGARAEESGGYVVGCACCVPCSSPADSGSPLVAGCRYCTWPPQVLPSA